MTPREYQANLDIIENALRDTQAMLAEAAATITAQAQEIERLRAELAKAQAVNRAFSEYRAWQAMKNRCRNPNVANYPRYGGRGISVCDAWSEGFEAFLADVGPRPSDSHSLGRIDNDGNYEPSNVRWELPNEQANNKSDSRFVEYRGERMTVKQAIRAAGSIVAQDTVNYRLKQGWSVERAVESRPRYWVQPDEGSV